MIASHEGEPPRNISMPVYLVSLILVGVLGVFGTFIFLGFNYAQGVIDVKRIEYIEEQNEIKKRKIEIIEETLPDIEEKIEEVEEIENELKEMHRLEENEKDVDVEKTLEDRIAELDNFIEKAEDIKKESQQVLNEIEGEEDNYTNIPTLKPTEGWIMRDFGPHESPFTGTIQMHRGVDIVGETGQPIMASADGVVVFSGVNAGYGLSIEIDHGNGYSTFYSHNKTNLVIEGDEVSRGQTIALMGSTGRSTGTHLHYEVRKDGIPIDPEGYLLIE